ncbi:MAG TPA: hypothetical protein VM513_11510, partial [Kofleriaceae bacterium]|nr:hypothetical protein [Kofleriaceae bacterium]
MLAALGGACEKKGGSLGPDKNLPAELQPTRASFDPSKVVVPALFGYVPADTPYVLGGFEAVGLDYYAKLKQGLGPSFGKMLTSARAQGDDEAMRLFDVIYEELGGKLDANSLEHLGLSAKPRFVVYGLGVVPAVARLEIKDETALRATLDRVATKLGEQLPPQENRGGKAYWRFTEDDVTGIVAILDNQLVGAIGPTASVEAKLDLILGIQKPAQSMADGKALIDVMQKHGFGPHLVGYLDTRKLGAQGLSLSDQPPPATCAPAVDQLAAKVPRIVMGYTEISGKRASGGAVIELEPGLLAELAALRTQVPGLGTALSDQPLLAFGGGVDIAKGAALLARAASAVRTTAEACNVPDLVEVAADAFDTLSQPLPPPATKITGFAAALHAFDMGDTGIKKLDGFGMVTASSASSPGSSSMTAPP